MLKFITLALLVCIAYSVVYGCGFDDGGDDWEESPRGSGYPMMGGEGPKGRGGRRQGRPQLRRPGRKGRGDSQEDSSEKGTMKKRAGCKYGKSGESDENRKPMRKPHQGKEFGPSESRRWYGKEKGRETSGERDGWRRRGGESGEGRRQRGPQKGRWSESEESDGKYKRRPSSRESGEDGWGKGRKERDSGESSEFGRKRGMQGRRFPIMPRMPLCPRWNDTFEESKCLWPGKDFFSSLPDSCIPREIAKKIPGPVAEYYKSKVVELNDVLQQLLKNRGINKQCGHCSMKVSCRRRVKPMRKSPRYPLLALLCKPIDIKFDIESCDDGAPCQATVINGGCPAPVPHFQLLPPNHPMIPAMKHFMPTKLPQHPGGGDFGPMFEKHYPEEEGGREGEKGPRFLRDDGGDMDGAKNETSGEKKSDSWESGEENKNCLKSFPLWHCVKSSDGSKCLCCCGNYYPDPKTGKCVKVKYGNNFPPVDFYV